MSMTRRDGVELLTLGAIWGASFLFMRVAAAPFGPLPLVWVRVAGAAMVLVPLLVWHGEARALRTHWRRLLVVGLLNSALPFALYGYALLTLSGSLAALFNAATPLCGALIARAWLGDPLGGRRALGLVVGFAGVFGLAFEKAGLRGDKVDTDAALAVGACLLATLSYGYSASYTRRHLAGVPPLALATGSQLAAALAITLPAASLWPVEPPGGWAWLAALLLAVVCTGAAYVLYFRLLAHAGAANTLTVTYLVPVFAMGWNALLLGEWPTFAMLVGGSVVLAGTALTTWPARAAAAGRDPASATAASSASDVLR